MPDLGNDGSGMLFAGRRRGAKAMPERWRLIALRLAVLWIAATAAAPRDVAAQAEADEDYVGPLVNQALETAKSGVEIPWSNPASGSSGMIVIERTFYRDPRTPCRDYRRTLERAGAPTAEIQGTGCRIGSGRWSLDEEDPRSIAATAPTVRAGTARPPEAAEPPDPEPAAGPAPPSCPALSAAPVPCDKPPAVVDYTMPTKTEL
jgi:17 kDa outer membrane surface antigen